MQLSVHLGLISIHNHTFESERVLSWPILS